MAANFGVGASLDPGLYDPGQGDTQGVALTPGVYYPLNSMFSVSHDPAFDPFGGAPSTSGFSIGNDPAISGIQPGPAPGGADNKTWLWVAVAAGLVLLVVLGGE